MLHGPRQPLNDTSSPSPISQNRIFLQCFNTSSQLFLAYFQEKRSRHEETLEDQSDYQRLTTPTKSALATWLVFTPVIIYAMTKRASNFLIYGGFVGSYFLNMLMVSRERRNQFREYLTLDTMLGGFSRYTLKSRDPLNSLIDSLPQTHYDELAEQYVERLRTRERENTRTLSNLVHSKDQNQQNENQNDQREHDFKPSLDQSVDLAPFMKKVGENRRELERRKEFSLRDAERARIEENRKEDKEIDIESDTEKKERRDWQRNQRKEIKREQERERKRDSFDSYDSDGGGGVKERSDFDESLLSREGRYEENRKRKEEDKKARDKRRTEREREREVKKEKDEMERSKRKNEETEFSSSFDGEKTKREERKRRHKGTRDRDEQNRNRDHHHTDERSDYGDDTDYFDKDESSSQGSRFQRSNQKTSTRSRSTAEKTRSKFSDELVDDD